MPEITVIKGIWFLPSNIEKTVLGVLTHDTEKGIYLEIEEDGDVGL
jgi:hypothetical protein